MINPNVSRLVNDFSYVFINLGHIDLGARPSTSSSIVIYDKPGGYVDTLWIAPWDSFLPMLTKYKLIFTRYE